MTGDSPLGIAPNDMFSKMIANQIFEKQWYSQNCALSEVRGLTLLPAAPLR